MSVPRHNHEKRLVLLRTVSFVCAAFVAYARQQGVHAHSHSILLRTSAPSRPKVEGLTLAQPTHPSDLLVLGRDPHRGRRVGHHALGLCRARAAGLPPRRAALHPYRERNGQGGPHVRGAPAVQREAG